MTAAVDLSGIFQFVSPAVPATRHDIERLRELQENFESGIDDRDVIVADRGYQGFQNEALKGTWIVKKKRQKNRQLSKEDVESNSKIEDIRRQIERCFGGVKMMFDCLLRPWRHDRNWLTQVARFCCAIYNNKLRYEKM
jgi:hypothetical protein